MARRGLTPEELNEFLARVSELPETRKIIHTSTHNARVGASRRGQPNPVWGETNRRVKSRPCTIDDGVTVYGSLKDLSAALGFGQHGARSPNFRYLDEGNPPTEGVTPSEHGE